MVSFGSPKSEDREEMLHIQTEPNQQHLQRNSNNSIFNATQTTFGGLLSYPKESMES